MVDNIQAISGHYRRLSADWPADLWSIIRLRGCPDCFPAAAVWIMTTMQQNDGMRPNTSFLLMAQYDGAAVIPLESVCRDFFGHLTVEKLLRKILRGEIALPIIRIEQSQKAARGVHLVDLADYLDKQRERALKECRQLSGEA
jgi:hypothetical protein